MADEPKPVATKPTDKQIADAIAEHDVASDRILVLVKYPFLAEVLNKRAITNSIKK